MPTGGYVPVPLKGANQSVLDPFTAKEQQMLLAGINKLLEVPEALATLNKADKVEVPVGEANVTLNMDPKTTPASMITLEDLLVLKKDIEGIRDERGPQSPDGNKEEDVT